MDELKEKILRKTSDLYLQYGIKSVTMDDVSKALAISKKTLYNVFPNKYSLVYDTVLYIRHCDIDRYNKFFEDSENAIEEMLKVNYVISYHLTNQTPWMEYDLKKYYPEISQRLEEESIRMMRAEVKQNIARGKKENYFREDVDATIIAELLVACVNGLQHTVREKTIVNYDSYFNNQVFIYHLRGVANKQGVEYVEKNYDMLMKKFETYLDSYSR